MGDVKKIIVPGKTPNATSFKTDEIVINPVDGKAYIKKTDNTVIELGSGASVNTGSLLENASANGNTITFTQGDGTTFDISVAGGGGGAISASDEGVTLSNDVTSFNFVGNAVTATGTTEVTVTINTGSLLLPSNLVSSSIQIADITSSLIETASVSNNTITFTQGDGSTFNIAINTASFSDTSSFIPFDGNRKISNSEMNDGVFNANYGGTNLKEFIEKVFFPNTNPTIATFSATIGEFETTTGSLTAASRSVVATDAEAQDLIFRTASSYTAGKFGVQTDGNIDVLVKTTESINTGTDPITSLDSHPINVEVEDTFGGITAGTIFIRVIPNTAPKFRQTSVGGAIITDFTASLNESSSAGSNKAEIFFTDDESDTITINTGSLSADFTDAFSLTIGGTSVQLNQITASLDFETTPKYEFTITASDQHAISGDDVVAVAHLPFQVKVVDNAGPTIGGSQTLSSINENSSNGAVVDTITATDAEGDTIVFSNFTLQEVNLDGGSDIQSSLGGSGLSDPTADAFNCSTSGQVTRKNGIFLNSDIANRYIYQITVSDAFNTTTNTGLVTILITDDTNPTISTPTSFIIESAVTNDDIVLNSDGRTGAQASINVTNGISCDFTLNSTNNLVAIDGDSTAVTSVNLKLGSDLSGSALDFGDTISVGVTASKATFATSLVESDFTINIAQLLAPTFTTTSFDVFNTNEARPSENLVRLNITDPQSFALNHNRFIFTDPSGQLEAIQDGNNYNIRPTSNLSGSTIYNFTASIENVKGFRSGSVSGSFTISQAGSGSLDQNGLTFTVVESALPGTSVNNVGSNQLTATYVSSEGTPAVSSFFTASDSSNKISVSTAGLVTTNNNFDFENPAASNNQTVNVHFEDQYGNIGTGSFIVDITVNDGPNISGFTATTANLTSSIAESTNLATFNVTSDSESDTPYSASLSGTDASLLKLVAQNANSSSWQVQNKNIIAVNGGDGTTLNFNIKLFDSASEFLHTANSNTSQTSHTLNIADPLAQTYFYTFTGDATNYADGSVERGYRVIGSGSYAGSLITTGFVTQSFLNSIVSGSLGTNFSTFKRAGLLSDSNQSGSAIVQKSGSLTDLTGTGGINSFGTITFPAVGVFAIIFPSASNVSNKPASIDNTEPSVDADESGVYYLRNAVSGTQGTAKSTVMYLTLNREVDGYTNYGVIVCTEDAGVLTSAYRLFPDEEDSPADV